MRPIFSKLQESLKLALRSLPPDSYFNLVGFGNFFRPLHPKSLRLSDETLSYATRYLSKIQPNFGGTEILSPLQWALDQPIIDGFPRKIFIITDGQITNSEKVLDLTRKCCGKSSIFTLGAGDIVNKPLVWLSAFPRRPLFEIGTKDRSFSLDRKWNFWVGPW